MRPQAREETTCDHQWLVEPCGRHEKCADCGDVRVQSDHRVIHIDITGQIAARANGLIELLLARDEPSPAPILDYLASTMRDEGATEGEIAVRQQRWVFEPMLAAEALAFERGFLAALGKPPEDEPTDLNPYRRSKGTP